MRRTYLLTTTAVVMLGLFCFSGCRKKQMSQEDIGYATDHAVTEQTFDDVQNIADQAQGLSAGATMAYRTTGSSCASVTKAPGVITIDFGTADCICRDGRKRRGTIIVNYTGNYADSGSVHTITFDNFYQNDNKVTGTKTVTNMGHDSHQQPYFDVEVNGAVTLQSGGTISASWSRVRTWTQGFNTPDDITDDQYSITGNGTLTRANGQLVTITITSPLLVACSCHWIEMGSVKYSLPGGISRVLDYGDNPSCDATATVTLANGNTRTVTLP